MFDFIFIFLLLTFGKPEQYPLLQTYYVDHIGRSDLRYQVSHFGVSFTALGYNENEITQKNLRSIKIATPYWFQFIDNHYHYLPLARSVFNYSTFAQFSPKSYFLTSASFLTPESYTFKITNIHDSKNLTITDAFTTSRNIVIKHINPTTLMPGNSLSIEFILLPTELTTTFSAVVIILTNMGNLPYFISCQQMHLIQGNDTIQTIFHQCSAMKSNLTVFLSPFFGQRVISVYYDALLFHTGKSTMASKFIVFNMLSLKNGFYVSFINFVSQEPKNTTIPLFICVSSKFLQSYYPVILVNVVTSHSSTSEAEIKIVNPTPHQFTIISVTLQKDAPSNIKVELNPQPITCSKFTYTNIGRIVVHGNRQGEIITSITVSYETVIDLTKIAQFIEIPVYASVVHGYLEPSEQRLNLLQLDNSFNRINFTNHFKVPIAIVSARTDSNLFKVVDFVPNVVQPGETSDDIIVQFTHRPLSFSFESTLIVETNATNHYIPIKGFNGQLTISDSNSSVTQMHIFEQLGNVMTGSSMKFVYFIRNPNPIRYSMNDYNATPGITVNGFWNTNEHGSLRGHQMLPFAIEEIHIYVGFNNIRNNKPRNDSIAIGTSSSYVQITIEWTPVQGNYFLTMVIPPLLCFGFTYHTNVSLNSTYAVTLQLINFTVNVPTSDISTTSPYIRPHIYTNLGSVNLTFNTEIFQNNEIMSLFDFKRSWVELRKLWQKYFTNNLHYEIEFKLFIKKNSFFRFKYQIQITASYFNDLECDLGYILPYTEAHGSVEHYNFFNTSVVYHFYPRVTVHSDYESLISDPNSYIDFNFTVVATALGKYNEKIPIATNATKPFFIQIHAEVVAPNVYFVDFFGEKINRVLFSSADSAISTHTIFLINNGKTNVEVGQFFVRSPLFTVNQKCTGFLPINTTCRVDISVVLDYLRNQTEESTLLLYVHGLQVTCKLAVEIGDEAMKKIEKRRFIKFIAVVTLALLLPIYELISAIYKSNKLGKDIEERYLLLDSEIEKLSVSIKSSIATQVVIKHEEVSCGKWIPATEIRQSLTSEVIDSLEEIINSLN